MKHYLAKQYSRLFELTEVLATRRLERRALADQLDVRFKKFAAGKLPIDFLQDSVRNWANALAAEYQAMVDYNNTLAAFQFAKGTLLDYGQVHLVEGPTSGPCSVRAVDHEHKRSQLLAEQKAAVPIAQASIESGRILYPEMPTRDGASLPALWADRSPVRADPKPLVQVQDGLPEARSSNSRPTVGHDMPPMPTLRNEITQVSHFPGATLGTPNGR